MKTRSNLKPATKVAANSWPLSSTWLFLLLALVCLAVLFGRANGGETIATNSEKIATEKSATISPNYLCGGCDGDEGLDSECWFEGDICLEREDVRLYMNARFQPQSEAPSAVSKSEFVVMVYMVDYLFNDGVHLSAENLATLANQELCDEINIECLLRTVSRVMRIDKATLQPATK